jgi:hypothetical protein
MNVRAAIDPNGNEQWTDSDVVWGPTSSPHDNWQQFSIDAKATGDKMTVFTSANFGIPGVNQCRQFLDTWYDNAELVMISEAAPPAATPETQPSEQSTSGVTICVNAFHDVNANGLHDPNEGYMPDVTFTVANQNAIVGTVISDGTENAKCFLNLEVGMYQVAQQVPAQYQMTSAANVAVEAPVDSTVSVEFGSRVRGEPVTEVSPGDSTAAGAPAAGNNEQSAALTGPTSGGMICVNAFHDENANAAIDPNEGYMAGVTLAVASGGSVIGQVISAGSDVPQCFDNLEPGPYEVTQQVSGPLEMTTADSVMLAVAEGQAMQVEFGSRLQTDHGGTTPSETDGTDASTEPEEGTDDGGLDLLAVVGLAAIILGVILLGALIFFLLRR